MTVAERFWAKVQQTDGCWEWAGARSVRGYGRFNYGGSNRRAHRIAWLLTNGPIPDGLLVLHHCDNPPCVRPDHLWLGSLSDNARDMVAKGHHAMKTRPTLVRRGSQTWNAKLTEAAVARIRQAHAEGTPRASLAREYRVTTWTIDGVVRGRSWRHVA